MGTPRRPADDHERRQRAQLCLDGLYVGDAFGGRFNFRDQASRALPPSPWYFSDDTVMAIALVEVLDRHGRVEQDELARLFGQRYRADPYRGYGLSVRRVLEAIADGERSCAAACSIYEG